MTAMKQKLVLCFLFGLCSAASATSDFQANFTVKPGASSYPYAGRANVIENGQVIPICAADWDMNDAEVACREMGLGFVHSITVWLGVNRADSSVSRCLNSVKCYGHEERLSDCEFDEPRFINSRRPQNDKGIVCYGPPSEASVRLVSGPDQYSGYVQVKLASGSWDELYGYYGYWYMYDYISNICRQLGFGELNW